MTPRMLDLFAGLGGASAAMRARGWEVVRVELDPAFGPEIVADLGGWRAPRALRGVDLLWASPPCTEFSREAMPWCRTGRPPSLELVRATLRIVEAVRPRFWCLENVRGAIPHLRPLLGPPIASSGPVFLWGRLPAGLTLPRVAPYKERLSSRRRAERSQIPYPISEAVALAVEGAARRPAPPARAK